MGYIDEICLYFLWFRSRVSLCSMLFILATATNSTSTFVSPPTCLSVRPSVCHSLFLTMFLSLGIHETCISHLCNEMLAMCTFSGHRVKGTGGSKFLSCPLFGCMPIWWINFIFVTNTTHEVTMCSASFSGERDQRWWSHRSFDVFVVSALMAFDVATAIRFLDLHVYNWISFHLWHRKRIDFYTKDTIHAWYFWHALELYINSGEHVYPHS